MKAVNLIPPDERRGGSAAGRSGGAVYTLLGVLAALLVVLGAYAVFSRQVADRQSRLAELQAQTAQISAQAQDLERYAEFAQLRTQRVAALRTLAGARVEWKRVLEELSVALSDDVRLSSLTGSLAGGEGAPPGAPAPGGGTASGAEGTAASAEGGPTLQLAGCTTGDRAVAQMLVRLRQMSGVRDVQLASATEEEESATEGVPASCDTAFDMTVAFTPLPGAAAAGVATPQAGAPAEGAQSPGGGEAPDQAAPAEPSGGGGTSG